jgi:hypothetical protein
MQGSHHPFSRRVLLVEKTDEILERESEATRAPKPGRVHARRRPLLGAQAPNPAEL